MSWKFGKCCLFMEKKTKNIFSRIFGVSRGSFFGGNAYFGIWVKIVVFISPVIIILQSPYWAQNYRLVRIFPTSYRWMLCYFLLFKILPKKRLSGIYRGISWSSRQDKVVSQRTALILIYIEILVIGHYKQHATLHVSKQSSFAKNGWYHPHVLPISNDPVIWCRPTNIFVIFRLRRHPLHPLTTSHKVSQIFCKL